MIRPRADVTVERARVLHALPASRAHLEGALARLSPAAVGVPPQALLLVRRLAPRAPLGTGMRADAFVADLHETLRDRLARARAPGSGSADDDLLFRDEAELAAAVIASWLDGVPPQACAWRALVTAGEPPPAWWRRTILPDARLLPQVIAALAREQRAIAWVAGLDEQEVRQAIRSLAAAHGVAPADRAAPTTSHDQPSSNDSPEARALRASLRALVPEIAECALQEPQRALVTLALVLHRRPALVRSEAFPAALALSVVAPVGRPGRARTSLHPPADASIARGPSHRNDVPESAARRSAIVPGVIGKPADPLKSAASLLPAASVETRFGGLLFLLNALIAMEVYGEFTRPLAVPNALDPFDLLALLGRRWFGAAFRRDPIVPVLAALAGREPNEPIRFTPPSWHVPDLWLAPWPEQRTGGWHAAGFPLDLAAADPRLPTPPQARWIAALALYLQARLARALDIGERAAVGLTCRQLASIACVGDRVTATFTLASHPLALRLAGLDRDPGYMPAARRDVRFVFA